MKQMEICEHQNAQICWFHQVQSCKGNLSRWLLNFQKAVEMCIQKKLKVEGPSLLKSRKKKLNRMLTHILDMLSNHWDIQYLKWLNEDKIDNSKMPNLHRALEQLIMGPMISIHSNEWIFWQLWGRTLSSSQDSRYISKDSKRKYGRVKNNLCPFHQ